jgi:hypothetical protein
MGGGDLIEEVLTAAGDDALTAVAELIESLKKHEAPAFFTSTGSCRPERRSPKAASMMANPFDGLSCRAFSGSSART